MPAPRFVRPLAAAELAVLEERYRRTHDADERSRCPMILFSARGKTVPEIADLTLFDPDTVLYWLDRYEAEGVDVLACAWAHPPSLSLQQLLLWMRLFPLRCARLVRCGRERRGGPGC